MRCVNLQGTNITHKDINSTSINKVYTKNIITMMERNHDRPLISSKETNPSHMLWFPSYLRGILYRYGYIR